MNVQKVCFVDIWLKGLCLKLCNTVRCNKGLVSHDSFAVEKENLDPVPRSKELLIPSMSKIVWWVWSIERHVDRCWCKEGDEWGTGWVCHSEADLLDSLASRISVELIVEGSRFPRLLCSVWDILSHCWFCPCRMSHARCYMEWVLNSCL
jgi:hypothetical protein